MSQRQTNVLSVESDKETCATVYPTTHSALELKIDLFGTWAWENVWNF